MKSNEFINEDEVIDEWSRTSKGIRPALEAKGYKFIGSGADQSAYLEPGGQTVLKIFGSWKSTEGKPSAFTASHQMFFTWAKFCMKNEDNPFLPKFGGYESFVFKNRTYLQIRQEVLRESGKVGRIVESTAKFIEQKGISDIRAMVNLDQDAKKLVKLLGEDRARLLAKTVDSLMKIGDKRGYSWDLHEGNILKRVDGTPVIVDPWIVK